jgi:hypothetical protein
LNNTINIILPNTPKSSTRSLSISTTSTHLSSPFTCYMPRPSNSSRFHDLNDCNNLSSSLIYEYPPALPMALHNFKHLKQCQLYLAGTQLLCC